MSELQALRKLHMSAMAMRNTAPVDDDFPEMMHNFDTAIEHASPLIGTHDDAGINDLAVRQFDWVESMNWHNKTVLEALALIASEVRVVIIVINEPGSNHGL